MYVFLSKIAIDIFVITADTMIAAEKAAAISYVGFLLLRQTLQGLRRLYRRKRRIH